VLTSDTSFGLAISTACQANYVDVVAPALLHLYDARGTMMAFVKNLAEDEINRTDNPAILFRGNNAPPRILTTFIHAQAGLYLSETLGPLLRDVIQDPRVQDFSVASTVPSEEREQNLRHIQTIAKSFLDAIVHSAGSFPPYAPLVMKLTLRSLREVFHHIAVCTGKRFPGNATAPHIGVGSIVFLRFIGPAISIPAMQPNEELAAGVKRALVLITKVIQNLASNAMFTEQNVISLNPFLEANIKRVLEFIRSISV
jgi:neurofibromin 1